MTMDSALMKITKIIHVDVNQKIAADTLSERDLDGE